MASGDLWSHLPAALLARSIARLQLAEHCQCALARGDVPVAARPEVAGRGQVEGPRLAPREARAGAGAGCAHCRTAQPPARRGRALRLPPSRSISHKNSLALALAVSRMDAARLARCPTLNLQHTSPLFRLYLQTMPLLLCCLSVGLSSSIPSSFLSS